jgi:hypothetical protein
LVISSLEFGGGRGPAFIDGLSRLGWVEGKNIIFEHREFVQWASSVYTAADAKTVGVGSPC